MKKTQKKIFGFLALFLVVAMTFFAAILPAPKTQAIAASIVDTVRIRVVGGVPSVDTEGIESGSTIVSPKQTVIIPYENVETLTVGVKYTDADGNEYEFGLINANVNFAPDTMIINYDFTTGEFDYSYVYYDDDQNPHTATGQGQMPHYGYGDYVFIVTGYGSDGATDNGDISFGFVPVTADVSSDKESGDVKVDLEYDADIETGLGTGEVSEIKLNIYDKNGNLVAGSPIMVTPPTKTVEIPFADYGLEAGEYTLEVIAYNRDGEALYKPLVKPFIYDYNPGGGDSDDGESEDGGGSSSIVVPNTGGPLGGLNVSRIDCLTTGLIIFFVVGVGGAWFIIKRDKKTSKRRK